MASNCCGDVVEIDREALGFDDELFDLRTEEICALGRGGAGELCDDRSYAGAGFEQAIVQELGDDLVGSVRVDFEVAREGAYGGKRFSGLELPGDDGAGCGVDDLVRDGDTGSEGEAEGKHKCTNTTSTVRASRRFCEVSHRLRALLENSGIVDDYENNR